MREVEGMEEVGELCCPKALVKCVAQNSEGSGGHRTAVCQAEVEGLLEAKGKARKYSQVPRLQFMPSRTIALVALAYEVPHLREVDHMTRVGQVSVPPHEVTQAARAQDQFEKDKRVPEEPLRVVHVRRIWKAEAAEVEEVVLVGEDERAKAKSCEREGRGLLVMLEGR